MNDNNLHINQQLPSNYPEPDVPADEAWANMDAMLTAQAPPPSNGGSAGGIFSYWKSFLLIIVVSGLIFFAINKLYKKTVAGVNYDAENSITVKQSLPVSTTPPGKKNSLSQNNNIITVDSTLKTDAAIQDKQNKLTTVTVTADVDNAFSDGNKKLNNAEKYPANPLHDPAFNKSTKNKPADKNINQTNEAHRLSNSSQKKNDIDNEVFNEEKKLSIDRQNIKLNLSNSAIITKDPQQKNNRNINDPKINNEDNLSKKSEIIIKPIPKEPAVQINSSYSAIALKGLLSKQSEQNKVSKNVVPKRNKNNKGFFEDINYGLQLNANITLQNTCLCNYFKDANGKNHPWKLLIPGIWAGKTFANKHEVLLQFNPYQQYFTNSRPVNSQSVDLPYGIFPNTTPGDKSINVIKISGLNAGVQYNYYLKTKWGVGAGIDFNTQSRALIAEQIKRVLDDEIVFYKFYSVKNSTDSLQYLKPSFITSNLKVMYNFKNFQVGAKLQLPVTNLSSDKSYRVQPINAQLFARWRIN